MTITIYELIGLIKDNKAPKKIKIYDDIFELLATHYYLNGILEREKDLYYKISGGYAILNDTVEILPEENGWEDIKEINFVDKFEDSYYDTCLIKIGAVCNQLIKNQKYLKERLEEK